VKLARPHIKFRALASILNPEAALQNVDLFCIGC
jgi:hypothetical protein